MAFQLDASQTVTNTGLANLVANNGVFLTGWTSGRIALSGKMDALISVEITSTGTNRQAGSVNVWLYAALNDGLGGAVIWPDIFSSGTEASVGAATLHDSELYGSSLKLLAALNFDTGASDVCS